MKRGPQLAALALGLALATPVRAQPLEPLDELAIDGTVRDESGAPVAGADVVVSRGDGSARRVAVTDRQGHFALSPGHAGPARILVVSGRGARCSEAPFVVVPGHRASLVIVDDRRGPGLQIHAVRYGGEGDARILEGQPGASRTRDLAGALLALPGVAPATTPSTGPSLAGLDPSEVPLSFEGFRLNDPITGTAPLELSLNLAGHVVYQAGPEPRLSMHAPWLAETTTNTFVGTDLVTPARGADDVSRPSGTAWVPRYEAMLVRVWPRRGRAVVAVALDQPHWSADPTSTEGPRGQRTFGGSALVWGETTIGDWQLGGGVMAYRGGLTYGRSGPVETGAALASESRDNGVVGVTARRQLAPGENDLSLALGTTFSDRDFTPVARAPGGTRGYRHHLAGVWRLGGHLAGAHRVSLSAGIDRETGSLTGTEPSRQAGVVVSGADATANLPALGLGERYAPVPELELEAALQVSFSSYRGATRLADGTSHERSFSTKTLLAPRFGLSYRPFARSPSPTTVVLSAEAARTASRLPLAALMAPADGPRVALPAPSEDGLSGGANLLRQGRIGVRLGLWGYLRRTAEVIEDRFAASSGRLELFTPRTTLPVRRTYRALSVDGGVLFGRNVLGATVLLSRLTGNYAGFVDEASGQLRPASTGAFDGPDVEVNRAGPLPADRRYGVRAFARRELRLGENWRGSAVLRGRLDGGTPRSATGRSAASGEGQVFLVERGSVGRTRAVGALDAGLEFSRAIARARLLLILEGFNLTNHRPVIARDQRFTDTLPGQTPEPRPDYQRPIAYAEPLLLRLLLGIEF